RMCRAFARLYLSCMSRTNQPTPNADRTATTTPAASSTSLIGPPELGLRPNPQPLAYRAPVPSSPHRTGPSGSCPHLPPMQPNSHGRTRPAQPHSLDPPNTESATQTARHPRINTIGSHSHN